MKVDIFLISKSKKIEFWCKNVRDNTLVKEEVAESLDWIEKNNTKIIILDEINTSDLFLWLEKYSLSLSKKVPIAVINGDLSSEDKIKLMHFGVKSIIKNDCDIIFKMEIENLLDLSDYKNSTEEKVQLITKEIQKRELELIESISQAAEFKDPETGAHTKRVGHYSKVIAECLGFNEVFCENILRAAPMHDLGKIGIPDSILLKQGKLTEEEWEVMKRHPQMGYSIATKSGSDVMKMAGEIALTHHEKYNGNGYPKGLREEEIPWSGRIVALADVFDALSTERPYKKPWPLNEIVDEIKRQKGQHFCPKCVDVFLNNIDQFLKIQKDFPDE